MVVGEGVGRGVRVADGVGDGVSSGDSVGRGDAVAVGEGVGVGVFMFALLFVFVFEFEFVRLFVLKFAFKLKSKPRFVLTLVFAFARFAFTFAFELSAVPRITIQKPRAPKPSKNTVPKIVKITTFSVFGFGGCWYCGGGCCLATVGSGVIGTTIRGADGSLRTMTSSSSNEGGGAGTLFLIIVISPGSSSPSNPSRLSLGISVKLGASSSISGVPSFIQKRSMSSSYRVSHVGQYFIFG